MATPLKQLGASEIDTKLAPHQFCERLCLVKSSSDTDFAFTPGRAGPDQTVSVNKLWPALKFHTFNELMDQINMMGKDPKAIAKMKAKFSIEAHKLARNVGSLSNAGFAYLLGKGSQSKNFLTLLRKNDSGELIEDGVIFDFFNSMIEMESDEGYCATPEFQHAFKIAMTRMEVEEIGDDDMPVNVANVNSAKKTSAVEEPTKPVEEDRKDTPRRTSPRKKKPEVPVETVEFSGKEGASDTSSFGVDFPGEQDDNDERENQAGKKSPKGIRASPVANGVDNWTEMWNSMIADGWSWIQGDGLVDWYYLHPNFANRGKSEIMKKGKEGEDYFINQESVMRYAKKYLGFRGEVATPATNGNKNQRRSRKRTATVAATTEPRKTKKEKKNSKSGKKKSNKKSKKEESDTKGRRKTKILMHSNENESVSDSSHFSKGAGAEGFGPGSPTVSEAEADIGVKSAQKKLTYKQQMSTPETAEESASSGDDSSATSSASNGTEAESDVSEESSVDKTYHVMSSGDAWKLLMEHFGFKYHQGMYCLPGPENKPGKDSFAIEGRHYFSTLVDLRKHLCAYGIPKCKKFLAYTDVDAIGRWVRLAHVQGLPDAAFVNPEDIGLLDFRQAWQMLQKLGLTWSNGHYIVNDPDPNKQPKKFEGQEAMCKHLARFGIPVIRGCVGLNEEDRLRLDLWITGSHIDSFKRIDPDKENLNEITPRRSRSKRSSDAAESSKDDEDLLQRSPKDQKQALGHREYQMAFIGLKTQRKMGLSRIDAAKSFELLVEHYNFTEMHSYDEAHYGSTYFCFPDVEPNEKFKLGVDFFESLQDMREYLCAYGLPPRAKRTRISDNDTAKLEQWIRSAHIKEPYDETVSSSGEMKPKEAKNILKGLGYHFSNQFGYFLLPDATSHKSQVGRDRFEQLIDLFNHIARFGLSSSRDGGVSSSADLQKLLLFITSVATNDLNKRIECRQPLPKQNPIVLIKCPPAAAAAAKQSELDYDATEVDAKTPKQVPVVMDQEDTPESKQETPRKQKGLLNYFTRGVTSVMKAALTPGKHNSAQSEFDADTSFQNEASESHSISSTREDTSPPSLEETALDKYAESSVQDKVAYSLSDDQKCLPWVELWKEMRAEGWRFLSGNDLTVDYYYAHPRCAGMKKKEVLSGEKGLDYFESEEEIQVFAKNHLGWRGEKWFSTPGETMMSSPDTAEETSDQEKGDSYSLSKSQKHLPWAELWKEMRAEGWRFLPGSKNVDYYYAHPRCAGMNKTTLLCGKKGLDYFESEEEIQAFAKQRLGWKGEKLLSTPGETMMSSPQKASATNKRKERNLSKEVPSPTKKPRADHQRSSAKPVPKSPTPYNKAPSPANSKQSSTASRSTASRSKKNSICLPDKQLTYKDKLEYCKLTLHPSYKLKTGRLSSTSNSVVEQLENEIKLFMKRAMETGYEIDGMTAQSPGFMYICGGPGTGKTTAVAACLQQLANWSSELGVAKPCSCHINIASISSGGVKKEMYKVMSKKLEIDKSSSEVEFMNQFKKKGMILVVDEVDMLFKSHGGSGDEWFSTLIEWCEDKELPFSMIGISNSVNDRYATKIRELSNHPHELVFPTYNETDLLDILQKRVGKKIVDTKALQLIAKRVAASTGDARKALEITSNAVDKALDACSDKWLEEVEDDCYPLVKLPQMMRAIREGMPTRHEEIIRGLPQAAKVILCIAVSLGQVWGPTAAVSIATLKKYAVQATHRSMLDDASLGQISNLVEMLMDSGLLTTDHDGCCNFNAIDHNTRLHLGVQLDDVEIALEKTLLEESSFYRSLVDYVKRECPRPDE